MDDIKRNFLEKAINTLEDEKYMSDSGKILIAQFRLERFVEDFLSHYAKKYINGDW